MGKFFIGSELVRVSFPDGEWVDIKEELTQADQDYVLNAMASARLDGKETPEIEMHLGSLALLERAVVAWSFMEDSQPVPVSRDNISRLRTTYRSRVLQEINQRDKQAREYAAKN